MVIQTLFLHHYMLKIFLLQFMLVVKEHLLKFKLKLIKTH